MKRQLFWPSAVAAVLAAPAGAEPAGPDPASERERNLAKADKSRFHLFNPTPKELMREMSTDRPDKTESAYTLDAGHFQIELDVINYTYDREHAGGQTTQVESWSFSPFNLKVGLANNLDLQAILETWNYERTKTSAAGVTSRQHQRGLGDLTCRLKYNFWGNDGGTTALAIMPFVKFPINQDHLGNNSVEGGVIFPLAVALPADFGLGMMTQYNFDRDASGDAYHTDFINSITLSHQIVGELSGYAEFFSQVSTEGDSVWVGSVDLGLTYGVTENLQLDAGVNIGVTKSAEDVNPFLGLSWRF